MKRHILLIALFCIIIFSILINTVDAKEDTTLTTLKDETSQITKETSYSTESKIQEDKPVESEVTTESNAEETTEEKSTEEPKEETKEDTPSTQTEQQTNNKKDDSSSTTNKNTQKRVKKKNKQPESKPSEESEPKELRVDKTDTSAYQSIQDAVDDASSESTIYVAKGSYNEKITVNKKVTIRGDDKKTTKITYTSKKNSYAVAITAQGATFSGLAVQNNAEGLYTSAIKISSSHVTIENCIINNTPIGIAIWSSSNTIENCQFNGCKDEGIALLGSQTISCDNNLIQNCQFFDNCDGIEMQSSSNNHIINCEFFDNTHAGIDAVGSSNNNNKITNCKIYNNNAFGIYLSQSSGNIIDNCKITNNEIMTIQSKENIISDSIIDTLSLNDESDVSIQGCLDLDQSKIKTRNSEYTITSNQNNFRSQIINKILELIPTQFLARIHLSFIH